MSPDVVSHIAQRYVVRVVARDRLAAIEQGVVTSPAYSCER